MKRGQYTRGQIAEILAQHAAGLTRAQIKEKYLVSDSALQYWLGRARMEARKPNGHAVAAPIAERPPVTTFADPIAVVLEDLRAQRAQIDGAIKALEALPRRRDAP